MLEVVALLGVLGEGVFRDQTPLLQLEQLHLMREVDLVAVFRGQAQLLLPELVL